MRDLPIELGLIQATTRSSENNQSNTPDFEAISNMNAEATKKALDELSAENMARYRDYVSERTRAIKDEVELKYKQTVDDERTKLKRERIIKHLGDKPVTIEHKKPKSESPEPAGEPYTWDMWRDETRPWLANAKEFVRDELAKNVKRTNLSAKKEMVSQNEVLNHIQTTIPKLEHNFANQAKLEHSIAKAETTHGEAIEQFNHSLATSIRECRSAREIANLQQVVTELTSRHQAHIQEIEDKISSMREELKALQNTSVAMVEHIESLVLPKSKGRNQITQGETFINRRLSTLSKAAHTDRVAQPKSRLLQMYDRNMRGGPDRDSRRNSQNKPKELGFFAKLKRFFMEE